MTPVPDQPLYEIVDLRRTHPVGSTQVRALDGVDLVLERGEMVAIEGASGSGKSTLLAVLGGLDRPTSGVVRFDGQDLRGLSDGQLTALRARAIGFVFQSFNLIPTLSAVQNVESVMGPLRLPSSQQRARALELLDRVGLAARAGHLPSRLSGGEQQRVAIARALANGPRVVLADEPTGNLDSATAREVMALLRGLGDDLGVTVVLVTHDHDVASQAPRRITMRDGLVVSDSAVAAAAAPWLRPVTHLVPRPARTARSAVLVGQAAALVALAGIGAAALMPHAEPAASTRSAQASAAVPRLQAPRLQVPAPAPVTVPVPVRKPASAPAVRKPAVVVAAAPRVRRVVPVVRVARAVPVPAAVPRPVSAPAPRTVPATTRPVPVATAAAPTPPAPVAPVVPVVGPLAGWPLGTGLLSFWTLFPTRTR
jgi:putative ABC transport system ATP-binding protein